MLVCKSIGYTIITSSDCLQVTRSMVKLCRYVAATCITYISIAYTFCITNDHFPCFHSVQSRMAVGYAPDGSVAPLYDLGWEGPAGQMFSTTDDLNKVWFVRSLHSKMAN